MSSAKLDLVRSIYAAWERGDYSSAEWAAAGIAAAIRYRLDAFEGFRVEAEAYRELDDERVLVLSRLSGRGRTSGLDLGQVGAQGAILFHARGGKVTRIVVCFDRQRALAEIGLAPEAGSGESQITRL